MAMLFDLCYSNALLNKHKHNLHTHQPVKTQYKNPELISSGFHLNEKGGCGNGEVPQRTKKQI